MGKKVRAYRVANPAFHPIGVGWLETFGGYVNETNCYDLPSACLEIAASASDAVSVLDGAKIEGTALMVPEGWAYTADDANKAYREWRKRFDIAACVERHLGLDRERDALLGLRDRLVESGYAVEIEDIADVYTGAGVMFHACEEDGDYPPSLSVFGGAIEHAVEARFVAPGKLGFVLTSYACQRFFGRKTFDDTGGVYGELAAICKGIALERETNEAIEHDGETAGEWWELCFPDIAPEQRRHIECVRALDDELVSASSWVNYSQRECSVTAYAMTASWEIVKGWPRERTVTVLDMFEGYACGDDAGSCHRRFVVKGRLDRAHAHRLIAQILVSGVPREIRIDNEQ